MSDIHKQISFPPNAAQASGQDDIDIRSLFLLLWRRKMMVIGLVLIGLSLATLITTFVKPRYTARSLLLIEGPVSQAGFEFQDLTGPIMPVRFDASFILSELEVLRSRTLARKVVQRLDLMMDSELNPRFQVQNSQEEAGTFKSLSVYGDELQSLPPEVIDREIATVVSRFLDRLTVRSIPGSSAVQVEYSSLEANKAALVANTLVDVYIESRMEGKFEAARKLTGWLDKRLEDLRGQVRRAEAAVEAYRVEYNLAEGTRTVVSAEQLSELNSQLILAKTQLAEAGAKLESTDAVETSVEVMNSELIASLKLDKVGLEGRLSELSSRYGEKHPQILEIKAELKKLRKTIRGETAKITQTLESEVRFAEARVEALESGLAEITGQRHEDNEAMIRLRELEREAESTRLIFDTFLETYKKSDEQEELQEPEARVISYAIVPRESSFPNTKLIFSLSGALSLFLGLLIAVLIEKLDNTYRSAGQLERALGFPCFALIPSVVKVAKKNMAQQVISKPASNLAEAVRTLRMVLNLRPPKTGKPKTVMITSSFPGEGKTTLSVWLARLAAKSGEKVILVDADLRRPNVHKVLNQKNTTSLVDYLTGQKELDEVIKKDEATGAHFIYAQSVPGTALDLVNGEKMRKLIESLKQVYDLVIIDSPACLAVSDSRVLATMADQTLYAVSWNETPREVVKSGVKQFHDMGYEPLAFVLTNVDVKRHVRYGYGDAVYYYGHDKEYFKN